MKNKIKTHKATAKRFKITGTGKVTRTSRQYRKQRFSRGNDRKAKNSDNKALTVAPIEASKVKKLLNI